MKAVIIAIGDELLIGQTIDTNSAYIAQKLNNIGIGIIRKLVIPDIEADIINALKEEIKNGDLLILTGGLGPTNDDITKSTLCKFFNTKLVCNQYALDHVIHYFKSRNRPLLEKNKMQAYIPENCIALFNREGTAPGMWFDYQQKIIISLPGVPFEMRNIIDEEVIPRLSSRPQKEYIIHSNIMTCGIGESFLSEKIKDIENNLPPKMHLAYLPQLGIVKLRLTGYGDKYPALLKKMNTYTDLIIKRVPEYVFANKEISLPEAVVNFLLENRMTLSTAESCTTGSIANNIGNIPGASQVYYGSIISYDNSVKRNILHVPEETLDKFGAVSEETVLQMAKKCLDMFQTDIAISVSGILGPTGGTAEKPVGLVWYAVATKRNIKSYKFTFPYDRLKNKELATVKGLDLIRTTLNKM